MRCDFVPARDEVVRGAAYQSFPAKAVEAAGPQRRFLSATDRRGSAREAGPGHRCFHVPARGYGFLGDRASRRFRMPPSRRR